MWYFTIVLISCGCYSTKLMVSKLNKMKVSITGLSPGLSRTALSLEAVRENLFLASSSFCWLLAVLSLWPRH